MWYFANRWSGLVPAFDDTVLSKDVVPWSMCGERASAHIVSSFSSVPVNLSELQPFFSIQISVGCGVHLELGEL